MKKRKYKGQSTLEYAILIAVVVGALVAMQIYMKRGVEGKLRESAIGEQFEAEKTSTTLTTTHKGTTVQKVAGDKTNVFADGTNDSTMQTQTETGSEKVDLP